MIEAALKARSDLTSTLEQLDEGLERQLVEMRRLADETDNTQRLKDTTRRRDWMAAEREARAEIEAHRDVVAQVSEMCRRLLLSLDESKERADVAQRYERVSAKWAELQRLSSAIRERLDAAQDECERLQRVSCDDAAAPERKRFY